MSVEDARHVLAGDQIQMEAGGPLFEVTATDQAPEEVRLSVLSEGSESSVLVLLPDDPVFVAVYSDSWE